MPTLGTVNLGAPVAITAWSAFALWIIANVARDCWRSYERRRQAYYQARLLDARQRAEQARARARAIQSEQEQAQRLAERRARLAKRHQEITWLDRLYELPPAAEPPTRPDPDSTDQHARRYGNQP